MRILHTYCLNYNIGDYALGIGVKNILRKYLDVDFIGETNIQGRDFTRYYINEVVNKRYDLLVIGGGGIIHGSHWPNGWFWLIDKELIKQIKIPFLIYGAGNNYWDQEEQIPQHGIEHLKETYRLANYFSVRNDGSFNRLKAQTGIEAQVIPDPGFHVNLSKNLYRPIKNEYIVVQLANDKVKYRFGSEEGRNTFIYQIRSVVSKLAEKYHVVLAPHVLDDLELSQKVINGILNTSIWDFQYFAFDHVHETLGYYKHAEFVIAMRGHGQIVPLSFNTPVISISNHPKHRGLMEELGMLHFNVEVADIELEANILMLVAEIEQDREKIQIKLARINQELAEQTREELKIIKDSI